MQSVKPEKLEAFMKVYREELPRIVAANPADYCYPVDYCPVVAGRMEAAFLAGSYNHDGKAIRAACKRLGIKPTRTAIEAFFAGAQS